MLKQLSCYTAGSGHMNSDRFYLRFPPLIMKTWYTKKKSKITFVPTKCCPNGGNIWLDLENVPQLRTTIILRRSNFRYFTFHHISNKLEYHSSLTRNTLSGEYPVS